MILQIWHIFHFVYLNWFDKTTNATIRTKRVLYKSYIGIEKWMGKKCQPMFMGLVFFSAWRMINGTSIGIKTPTNRELFVILWFTAQWWSIESVNIIHCNCTIWSNAHSIVYIDPKYFEWIPTSTPCTNNNSNSSNNRKSPWSKWNFLILRTQ